MLGSMFYVYKYHLRWMRATVDGWSLFAANSCIYVRIRSEWLDVDRGGEVEEVVKLKNSEIVVFIGISNIEVVINVLNISMHRRTATRTYKRTTFVKKHPRIGMKYINK